MMSWDIRVTQLDTPRVATTASVASTVRERETETEVCAAAAAEKTKRERERREAHRCGVRAGWVGTLLGLPIFETPFCHLVSHVFLEKVLTGVSESGQVSRAPIETSFLSSRFSSVSRKRFSPSVTESGQVVGSFAGMPLLRSRSCHLVSQVLILNRLSQVLLLNPGRWVGPLLRPGMTLLRPHFVISLLE